MKTAKPILAAALAAALSLPAVSSAAGLGAFVGFRDTETLDSSVEFGGQIEFDFVPCLTLIGRAAYAGDFDDIELAGGGFKASDVALVPAEVGLMLRPPELFGFLGIYAGAGAGWYFLPGFDVVAGDRTLAETKDVTDLVGYWICGGVEVGVPSFHVFAEARYTHAKKDDVDFDMKEGYGSSGSLSGDIDLSGMTYALGLRVDW